jgi:hypothetical protein
MIRYGIYIPLACMVLFSLWDLFTGGPGDWLDQLLTNALVIGLGCQLLGFAVGHLFKADAIAEHIGWKKGSPFQLEVGIADLAIGILGILCAWFSGGFRLATVIAATIWLWGCVAGHIRDMIRNRNFSPGSAGFVFYWGLLYPVFLIVLLFLAS